MAREKEPREERSNRGSQGSLSPQLARYMRKVVDALQRGRRFDAVRLFKQAQESDGIPREANLPDWLRRVIGKKAAARLTDAFARTACFYCDKGRESCESCGGRDRLADGSICERCVGLGVAGCDCCNGSGWITINYVPRGLWHPVLRIRTQNAIDELKALLQQPIPRASSRGPSSAGKKAARLLLRFETVLGVLENTVVAAEQASVDSRESAERLSKLVGASLRAGAKADKPVRRILRCLAEVARLEAESARTQPNKRFESTKSEYYQRLSKSKDFGGTALEHPFLQQALRKHGRKRG